MFKDDNGVGTGVEVAVFAQFVSDSLIGTIETLSGELVDGLGEASGEFSRKNRSRSMRGAWMSVRRPSSVPLHKHVWCWACQL